MVSLPALPPAYGHVTGMPRRYKPDGESNVPIVKKNIKSYLSVDSQNFGSRKKESCIVGLVHGKIRHSSTCSASCFARMEGHCR